MDALDYSHFLAETCRRDPEWASALRAGRVDVTPSAEAVRADWNCLCDITETAMFDRAARQLRMRQQAGVYWRLLQGLEPDTATMATMTVMAEASLEASLTHHFRSQVALWGAPSDPRIAIIGMGKLGGRELNVSSDIDIFCVYGSDGDTQGPRVRDNADFFTRVIQGMAKSLDQQTADGFVFRVDQRLRPWGSAGRLVLPVSAVTAYYEQHGREWERFALVKARTVAGDLSLGESLLAELTPFMYRKYLDFGVFESIRDLKQKIAAEVRRQGKTDNVKLGEGGIREAEFIVQALQLLRGGQLPDLRTPSMLAAIDALIRHELMPASVARQLRADYGWLRHVEHVIQAESDQQTQAVPAEPERRLVLAQMLGFSEVEAFETTLQQTMQRIRHEFTQFLGEPETSPTASNPISEAVIQRLEAYLLEPQCERLEAVARSRLVRVIGLLGPLLSRYEAPCTDRMLAFLTTCLRRSAYLALLAEEPTVLQRMVDLIAQSPWIAKRLTEMPILLDELLGLRVDQVLLDRQALGRELQSRLARLDPDDAEALIETLVQFARGQAFRVAVFEVTEDIPLMRVSDQLTWIAEAVIAEVLAFAYRDVEAKHGRPVGAEQDSGIAVLGYGKLGGIEMSYGSDLDLVFVHAIDAQAETSGASPIEGGVFVQRVVRRVIALLETQTRFGKLFEIDIRLRPSGRSGLMVIGLDAFAKYLDEEAWTWELQAFVRARPVAGDAALSDQLVALRRSVLVTPRPLAQLRDEVVAMREKMRTHLATPTGSDAVNLKHDAGGIVDIEFMVQYQILAHASQYPELATYTDNIRQLEGLVTTGCVQEADARLLSDAYVRYRRSQHHALLAEQTARQDHSFAVERAQVQALWATWMINH
ncbi:MAG: bifunctional [glutamate--ammonia ligase]-adenylyl-L-tyrosine phosphorylase/[glutamate--ammonia-ligase] adenylyltransferase [Gammaproteobacteria bacterium]|nr:bifunctional [glutamate--ammonia ligase]-adenylyl-L-tyrosine phosphorylase/[glutamate--ammonia-ligase] adenylyltransferase [Gammaproteobacteria bacterium]